MKVRLTVLWGDMHLLEYRVARHAPRWLLLLLLLLLHLLSLVHLGILLLAAKLRLLCFAFCLLLSLLLSLSLCVLLGLLLSLLLSLLLGLLLHVTLLLCKHGVLLFVIVESWWRAGLLSVLQLRHLLVTLLLLTVVAHQLFLKASGGLLGTTWLRRKRLSWCMTLCRLLMLQPTLKVCLINTTVHWKRLLRLWS